MKACLASKTPDSNPHLFFHTHLVWVWACSQLWDWSAHLLPNCSAILITLCLKLSMTVSPLPTESITGAAPLLSVAANSTHTRKTQQRTQLIAQPFRNSPNHSLHWSLEEKATGEVWWTENPNKFFSEKGLLYNPIHQHWTWNPDIKLQWQLARASMSLTMKLQPNATKFLLWVILKRHEDDNTTRSRVFQVCKFYHCVVKLANQQHLPVYTKYHKWYWSSNFALTQGYHNPSWSCEAMADLELPPVCQLLSNSLPRSISKTYNSCLN